MNTAALASSIVTLLTFDHLGAIGTKFLNQIYSPYLHVLSHGAFPSIGLTNF